MGTHLIATFRCVPPNALDIINKKGVIYMLKSKVNLEEITFKNGYEEWLSFKKNQVKESTYLTYKFKAKKHLVPDLGNKNLLELLSFDMNSYIYSKKTILKNGESIIKDCVMLLKSILKFLRKKYNVPYDLDFGFRTTNNLNEISVFNEKERIKLIKCINNSEDFKTLGILISLFSGLRIGEVCGLKWEDLDFENKLIRIRRTVERVYIENNSKIIITTPKSRKSVRNIPLAQILIDKLCTRRDREVSRVQDVRSPARERGLSAPHKGHFHRRAPPQLHKA